MAGPGIKPGTSDFESATLPTALYGPAGYLGIMIQAPVSHGQAIKVWVIFILIQESLVLRSLYNLDHRNPLVQQIFRKYNYLSSFKEIVFCWLPSHTNIRGNELADLEAKSALSLSITNLKIPHSDFKSNIHQYVMNKCQSAWEEQTGNKLHELKPDFNSKCSFLGYSRQIQTKITRCRIGHTRLTHSYLLTNEQPPFCISCNEPFTVKQFSHYLHRI